MRNALKLAVLCAGALAASLSFGDVSVTASRAYVNQRTALHPVTNDGQVVGYTLGVQSNIVLVSSDGNGVGSTVRAMKPIRLGSYLWEIGTEGEDWDKATNRLAQVYPSYRMGCTGVAAGRYHGRNLDWGYNRQATIVIRSPAREGKFGCIGIVDGALDDDFIESEAWTNAYESIPFSLGDGINEHGVVIQQNVIPKTLPSSHAWHTRRSDSIISFCIVRYALDRCTNAYQAAQLINAKIFVPTEFGFDFHYLVSDRTSSYIVEDGVVYSETATRPTDILTNFRVGGSTTFTTEKIPNWNTVETYGIGLERYENARTNGLDKTSLAGMTGTMTNLWYTKAYLPSTSPYWYTEHCDATLHPNFTVMAAKNNHSTQEWLDDIAQWYVDLTNEHDKASANYRGGKTWQTTHTSIYDRDSLSLILYTQEDPLSQRKFRLVKDKPTTDDVVLPEKWALSNVTNKNGGAVSAPDVGAIDSAWTNRYYIAAGKDVISGTNGYTVTIGSEAQTEGDETAVAIGTGAYANFSGVSVGGGAGANGYGAVAVGESYADGDGAIAIGSAGADYEGGVAIGYGAYSYETNAVVIGYGAESHGKDTITLGQSGTTTEKVYIGDTTIESSMEGKVQPILQNTNITFHVDGTDLIIRTNNVEVWHSWKSMQPAAAPIRRYALFLIHLNPNSASHPFADIELKATTNNYYGESMMFYCASSVNGDPAKSGNPTWEHDWCRIYVLTSKVDSDVRRWKRIRNTTDLGTYNPRELAIIVDPSAAYLRRGQGSDWLCESNDELIWSYVRITASGPEMDEGGTKQLWRPTMPVKWYTSLPAWANQTSF